VRNAVVAGALVVVTSLAQVAWASRLEVADAYPGLALVAVVAIAWNIGPRAGLLSACAGGLLLDLGSAGPVGPHALALLAGAYATGLGARRSESPNLLLVALTAALATLLYSSVLMALDALLGVSVPAFEAAVRLALGAAVYNSVLAPFAFVLVRALCLGRISRRAQA
jgi:rod shape-determining protein MreD